MAAGGVRIGTEFSQELFTAKGECWAYEKEVRAIREHPGLMALPKEYLSQIAFGLRASSDDIKKIRGCVSNSRVDYCQVVRDGTDFGMRLKAI